MKKPPASPVPSGASPCVLCGSLSRRRLFSIRGSRYVRCRDCRLVQMSPLPSAGPSGEDYAGFDLDAYRAFLRAFRLPQYDRDLDLIARHATGPRGFLLDVGCGTGEFLSSAAGRGYRAYGIEPSPAASAVARSVAPVVRGELLRLQLRKGRFDVATLWSVLEHTKAPGPFLDALREALRRGGLLALRVPDVSGLLPRLALLAYRLSFGAVRAPLSAAYQLDWHYKHFLGLDRRTLPRLLREHGFEPLEIRREMSYDLRTLGMRPGVLPSRGLPRAIAWAAFAIAFGLSRLLRMQDELVLVSRRQSRSR